MWYKVDEVNRLHQLSFSFFQVDRYKLVPRITAVHGYCAGFPTDLVFVANCFKVSSNLSITRESVTQKLISFCTRVTVLCYKPSVMLRPHASVLAGERDNVARVLPEFLTILKFLHYPEQIARNIVKVSG